jgi:murein L,D-transpeptidase YcbB/YkuD
MVRTRRSFIRILGGVAALAPFTAGLGNPALASAEADPAFAVPDGAADLASLVRQAALSLPAPDIRAKAAVEGTLARLQGLAIDHTRGRFILANIAAAEVIAYQDGREVLRSRAIVGAGRTRTPRLASVVPSVRLNPPWYVPASIEPTVRAAAGVFRRVNGRLVQPPGPRNPLGPIRIGLEDSDGVFLHGTSDPRLFARERRALSHGCVRVERILDLAAWVLDMPADALRVALATGRTRELTPPEEVRVALAYLTAWPGEDGRLVFHPDPYGLDRSPHRQAPRAVSRPVPAEPPAIAPAVPPSALLGEST